MHILDGYACYGLSVLRGSTVFTGATLDVTSVASAGINNDDDHQENSIAKKSCVDKDRFNCRKYQRRGNCVCDHYNIYCVWFQERCPLSCGVCEGQAGAGEPF